MSAKRERVNWRQYLESLEVWLNYKGFFLNFSKGADNSVCLEGKIVDIDSSLPLEKQVYCLLHESGHIVLFKNGQDLKAGRDTFKYRTATVIEEVQAWEKGKALAKRLAIPINEKKWEAEVLEAIGKYLEWATKQGEFEDED